MTAEVVIAVRGGRAAKSRCAERLGPEQRERLVEAMLADMLQAAGGTPAVTRVHVTTPTPGLARLAARAGAVAIAEQTLGLNAAFDAARRKLAETDPRATLILLPGDLPLLAPADLEAALALAGEGRVVLAPAAEGGTGAIVLDADVAFPFAFGRDSFRRHGEAVRGLGLELRVLETPGLGCDVDQPADLDMVLRSAPSSRTAGLLRALEHLPETGT